ncbi:MAG: hypothetical protein HZB51_30030 [Chloroflexi bacterium]|nr:hypothetical protein [Chloroflexota bacterium]
MRNGICPKCNSTQVYCGLATEGEGLTAGSYASQVEVATDETCATLWVDTYICSSCGYLEMHVANRAELSILMQADGWRKVS